MCSMMKRHASAGPRRAPTAAPAEAMGERAESSPQRAHPLAVLILNEDGDIAEEMATSLCRRGMTIHRVATPREARAAMLRDPSIGVLVADISLLEGPGLILASDLIAGREPFQPVELVLLTGYAAPAMEEAGALLRSIGLLSEPLRRRDVIATVEAALSRAISRRDPSLDHTGDRMH